MKKIVKSLIPVFVFMLLIAPAFSLAAEPWKGLVPCDTTDNPKPCDFNAFLNMINLIIQFILFNLAIPVSAIMFAYAGFLMVTAGESSSEAKTKAKGIFLNTLYGLVLAAGAWLIVRTLLSILGYDGGWIGFPLIV